MTRQEAFNIAKKHLLCQKVRATGDFGVCAFRTPEGLKCAIGALIPDDKYPGEDRMFDMLHEPEKHNLPDNAFMELLRHIHDYKNPSTWDYEFQQLAILCGLEQ